MLPALQVSEREPRLANAGVGGLRLGAGLLGMKPEGTSQTPSDPANALSGLSRLVLCLEPSSELAPLTAPGVEASAPPTRSQTPFWKSRPQRKRDFSTTAEGRGVALPGFTFSLYSVFGICAGVR